MTTATHMARATLMRLSEPADGLLTIAVEALGEEGVLVALESGSWRPEQLGALVETLRAYGLGAKAGVFTEALERWRVRWGDADGARDMRGMARLGARLVIPGDEEWPACWDDLGLEAPLALWVRGEHRLDQALERALAVVGARAATAYGTQLAGALGYELAATDVTVISGGAFGIDVAAHRAALSVGGGGRNVATVAFMAGGVDRLYPRGNVPVLEEIARTGLVVSETSPGMTPMRHRFLQRNRLIAAGSQATVVVEAGWRSGALNTARRAADLGRPVGAMPGSVHSAASAGCHRLIREGAAELISGVEDARQLLPQEPIRPDQQSLRLPQDDLSEAEELVFDALPVRGGADVSMLANRAGLQATGVMAALVALELRGNACQTARGWVKQL